LVDEGVIMEPFPDLKIDAFYDAQRAIAGLVTRTPLLESHLLGTDGDHNLYLKLENLQRTGSFKLRGASNKIMSLTMEERALGVVTISSGNHGRAVSYLAGKLGIQAIVCVSKFVPKHKIEIIEKLGAQVEIVGKDYDEADAHARKLVQEHGMTWIEPFDDPHVIAGQGTIGLEILEDLSEINAAIVPTSGGGLISGIALALKLSNPEIRVIGVTMERGPAMYLSLKAGELVPVVEEETLADALMGGLGDENHYTFQICRQYVDDIVLVSEDEIAEAMAYAFNEHRIVVEGGGAVGIAALREGKVEILGDSVIVLSGGNVDPDVLMRVVKDHSE
jgi:threonine dehydratase